MISQVLSGAITSSYNEKDSKNIQHWEPHALYEQRRQKINIFVCHVFSLLSHKLNCVRHSSHQHHQPQHIFYAANASTRCFFKTSKQSKSTTEIPKIYSCETEPLILSAAEAKEQRRTLFKIHNNDHVDNENGLDGARLRIVSNFVKEKSKEKLLSFSPKFMFQNYFYT